jgi:hypothetical protein
VSLGGLTGCELIAGIQDLRVGPSSIEGGVATTDGSADTEKDATSAVDHQAVDEPITSFDATERDAPHVEAAPPSDDAGPDAAGGDSAGDAMTVDAWVNDSAADETATDAPIDVVATDAITDATTRDAADSSTQSTDASYTTVLIDDMENSNGVPLGWLDGVKVDGTWYVFDDGSDGGVLTPAPGAPASAIIAAISGGRGTSAHAAHVTGNAGFVAYGAGMGFNLNSPQPPPGSFDASAHLGFTFWARSLGGGPTVVTFNVLDRNTAPPTSGGVCDGGACNGYYGFTLTLTSTWTPWTILYTDLKRPPWALPGPMLDSQHLIGAQFQANAGAAFDIWVDDISFVDP